MSGPTENPSHPSSGPASSTAGPHKHNILNRLDPRIDSDLDGSKTVGTAPPNSANTTPSRQSTASTSTSPTTAASHRTSHVGSVDTYTTGSTSQASQYDPSNPLAHSIHNDGLSGGTAATHDATHSTTSSTDYVNVDAYSPVSTHQGASHQSTGVAAPGYATDPDMAPAEEVNTSGLVLGYHPEKESIWTSGGVPGPAPEKEVASSEPVAHQPSTGLHSEPTESHALATADHEHKGVAQQGHDEVEVKDLGWNDPPERMAAPLVGKLPNEELWTLIRRFDKVRTTLSRTRRK